MLDLDEIRKAMESAGLPTDDIESVAGRMVSEKMMVLAIKQEFIILVEDANGVWTRVTQPEGGAPPRRKIRV